MAKQSVALASNTTRGQSAIGETPVDRYAEKKPGANFTDSGGKEHWTRRFRFPATKLKELSPYLKKSLDNLLPGSNRLDVYAPCIHECQIGDGEDGYVVATCDYQGPTREMILRPGRAFYETGTYVTTIKDEVAVFSDGGQILAQMGMSSEKIASAVVSLDVKDTLLIKHRGIVVVYEADSVADEWAVHEREQALRGKGGFLVVDDQGHMFPDLKLSEVQTSRRASDLSILDSVWKFSQNMDGWSESGVVAEHFYACDLHGVKVRYDPSTYTVFDADDKAMLPGTYMLRRLRRTDPHVIDGYASFAAFAPYFTWMY